VICKSFVNGLDIGKAVAHFRELIILWTLKTFIATWRLMRQLMKRIGLSNDTRLAESNRRRSA
jgi:hypothetical protein